MCVRSEVIQWFEDDVNDKLVNGTITGFIKQIYLVLICLTEDTLFA